MSTDANAMARAFLNDAYSVFSQRDLWLFVDPKPAATMAKLDALSSRHAQSAERLDYPYPQANSSRSLLSVLRPPALLTADAVDKSISTIISIFTRLTQQGAEKTDQYSVKQQQDAVSRQIQAREVREAILARTLSDTRLNAAEEAGRAALNRNAASKAMPAKLAAAGDKTEYTDPDLLSMMRNRAALLGLLSQLAVNSDFPSQLEGEIELPVILNAGMIPGAENIKAPFRQLRLMPISNEQILAMLLQFGIEPSLLEKLKRILAKLKGSKKLTKSLLSVFIALFIVAEHIVEELSLLLEEEEDIKEKLAYADSHRFIDSRRRVYI